MTDETLPADNTFETSEVLSPLIERTRLLQNCQAREMDLVEHVKDVCNNLILYSVLCHL